jgi:hypothetical protein
MQQMPRNFDIKILDKSSPKDTKGKVLENSDRPSIFVRFKLNIPPPPHKGFGTSVFGVLNVVKIPCRIVDIPIWWRA